MKKLFLKVFYSLTLFSCNTVNSAINEPVATYVKIESEKNQNEISFFIKIESPPNEREKIPNLVTVLIINNKGPILSADYKLLLNDKLLGSFHSTKILITHTAIEVKIKINENFLKEYNELIRLYPIEGNPFSKDGDKLVMVIENMKQK